MDESGWAPIELILWGWVTLGDLGDGRGRPPGLWPGCRGRSGLGWRRIRPGGGEGWRYQPKAA